MNVAANTPDFFVAGGTLHPDSPSYVQRLADDELFNLILSGELCYILTSRQMGKSSLMVRTHRRLREQGINTAIIDLTEIGITNVEQWYLVVVSLLAEQLNLAVDPILWWEERASLSVVHRFVRFLHDVALVEVEGPVVIFIDEIDTTLKLEFSDDLFAAIRFTHNTCAIDPAYSRLTFVLIGSAIPADLIKDATRTPFNVGRGIDLCEFSRKDAQVFRNGLETVYSGQGDAILNRIFYWTEGHPYLTQKLCLAIVKSKRKSWTDKQIDQLVEKLLLSEGARKETHLQYIRNKIVTSPQRRQLLTLYKEIHKGKRIRENEQSYVQSQLKVSGLIKAENGYLRVRNEIYRHIFDLRWIRTNTQINWLPVALVVAAISIMIAVLAISFVIYNVWTGIQCNEAIANFYQTNASEERVANLSKMLKLREFFGPTNCRYQFIVLFNGLPREDQLALFNTYNVNDTDVIALARGLLPMLADIEGTDATSPLLATMAQALNGLGAEEATKNLEHTIGSWLTGRELTRQGSYDEALDRYNAAISLSDGNPSLLYERAWILVRLSRYEQVLSDLDQVMAIAGQEPLAPTPTVLPSTSPPEILPPPSVENALTPTAKSTLSSQTDSTPISPRVSPTITPEVTATSSSTSTEINDFIPNPISAPILLEFATIWQIRSAVKDLIDNNQDLANFLATVPNSTYPNLRDFELIPTPNLLTATATPTPIVTLPAPGTTARPTPTFTLVVPPKTLTRSDVSAPSPTPATIPVDTPSTGKWLPVGSLTAGRHSHTATGLRDGRVLIVGGAQGAFEGPGLAAVEIYDPATKAWSTTGSLNDARSCHTTTLLPDGRVLVVGGWDGYPTPTFARAEIFDPSNGTWSYTGSLSVARRRHTATQLADGRVLVAGGYYAVGDDVITASAEIYDPASGTWRTTGSLNTPRQAHSATLLADGRVLVIGGYYGGLLASAEIYDPVSETWSNAPAPLSCHGAHHTSTSLLDGRALLVGGWCGDFRDEAEIFDPISETWTATAHLPEVREAHSATLLFDGRVLVVGGDDGAPSRYTSALIYDPADDTWTVADSLNIGRRSHTTTLLSNGSVIAVAGMDDAADYLNSAEVYTLPTYLE